MVFVDSNTPMYLVGAEHPNKNDAQRLLERPVTGGESLVTSAEVLQEILHRYAAIGLREAIQPALEAPLGIVDEVLPVERQDVRRASPHATRSTSGAWVATASPRSSVSTAGSTAFPASSASPEAVSGSRSGRG